MNEFPFPPPQSIHPLTERLSARFIASGGHLVLILVALLALLLWQNRRPVALSHLVLWTAVILIGAGLLELDSLAKPLLVAMGLTGLACTAWRRLRTDRPLSSIQTIGSVIAISSIAFLTWAFRPIVRETRTPSRLAQCKVNLKQIGLGLHNYESQYHHFPALASRSDARPRSWRVELLPYVELPRLRERYRDAEDWNSPHNSELARNRAQEVYVCPSNPHQMDAERRLYSAYVCPDGPDTFLVRGRGQTLGGVGDGTSHTIAVTEACGLEIVWTEPRDADIDQVPAGINRPGDRSGHSNGVLSSYHVGGAQVLMADGSVRFLSAGTSADALKSLLTANGGETVALPPSR